MKPKAYEKFLKNLCTLSLVFIILPLTYAKGASYGPVSYTTYDTTYDAIIKMYIRVINAYGTGKEGRHDLFNDAVINDFHHDAESPMDKRIKEAKKRVGFSIYDLNGDGVDELIIGENSAYVNEVFTIDDGKVRELIAAWGKYDCALLKNGYFIRYGHGGASTSTETVWKMNGAKKVSFVEGYYRNDEYNGFQEGTDYEVYLDNWFRLSKDPLKYNADFSETNKAPRGELLQWLKDKDSQLLSLTFIPLETIERGLDTDNIGVLCKEGKVGKKETINIRKAPNRSSKIVAKKKIGTFVNILGEEDEYYQIKYNKTIGYVLKQFVISLHDDPNIGAKKVSIYPSDYEDYLIRRYGTSFINQ